MTFLNGVENVFGENSLDVGWFWNLYGLGLDLRQAVRHVHLDFADDLMQFFVFFSFEDFVDLVEV